MAMPVTGTAPATSASLRSDWAAHGGDGLQKPQPVQRRSPQPAGRRWRPGVGVRRGGMMRPGAMPVAWERLPSLVGRRCRSRACRRREGGLTGAGRDRRGEEVVAHADGGPRRAR